MTREIAEHVFPVYKDKNGNTLFDKSKLPAEAKCQQINEVYRLCIWGKINKEAFECTYNIRDKINNKDLDLTNPSTYSTSCFSKKKDAQKRLNFFSTKEPKVIMAVGDITSESGYSCRDSELRKTKNSHINWWIFEDAKPWEEFKEYQTEDTVNKKVLK